MIPVISCVVTISSESRNGKQILHPFGRRLQINAYRLLDRSWRDEFRIDDEKY